MMDFNRVMVWLVASPLHHLVSRSIMVLHIRGVKSGRLFNVPVNYVAVDSPDGHRLLVTSRRDRLWWRNLRERVEIEATYRGQSVRAFARVSEDAGKVMEGFRYFFAVSPRSARYFKLELTSNGLVGEDDLARLARERVLIWVEIA